MTDVVVIHLPATLTQGIPVEILFRPPDLIDVRHGNTSNAWTPLHIAGGTIETRTQ